MANKLIDEYPLLVLPSLAKAVGLNSAIVIQQLHFLLENDRSVRVEDDVRWIRKTFQDWKFYFPFWSLSTIERQITKVRDEQGFIITTDEFNEDGRDRGLWYTVHYVKVRECTPPDRINDLNKNNKIDKIDKNNKNKNQARSYSYSLTDVTAKCVEILDTIPMMKRGKDPLAQYIDELRLENPDVDAVSLVQEFSDSLSRPGAKTIKNHRSVLAFRFREKQEEAEYNSGKTIEGYDGGPADQIEI